MSNIDTNQSKHRRLGRLGASAALAFLLSGASVLAQTVPNAAPPSYRVYGSHVAWKNDCVAGPSVLAGQPRYRIYQSHVAWRNDEVAADGGDAGRPSSQEWQLFQSHVDHSDECSLHPIVMSAPLPSYSWSDIERLFGGAAG